MTNSCWLCSFQRECQDSHPLALYPATAMLRDIVGQRLNDAAIRFREVHEVLILDRDITDDRLATFAKECLSEPEIEDLRVARMQGAHLMDAPTLAQWLKRCDSSWFERALEAGAFTTHFQPIVDFAESRIHGHECLVRLFTERAYSGAEIMEAAVERGRTHVFDSYTRKLSVRSAATQHTPGTKVFINFMPSSIYDPEFCMRSTLEAMAETHLQSKDIVFEVVESERIHDPKHLRKICNYYHKHGFGFALDDVGTGSNSLQMVCDLQPDYIKIDKSLIWGLDNPMYRSTVQKVADLAAEFKVKVIAEGIENAATAHTCLSLGISLMQGYYFSKPASQMVSCSADLINLAHNVGTRTVEIKRDANVPQAT